MDFRKFRKIHDLDRKLNVAESVRGWFYAVQGVRTRLETTRRHHQSLQDEMGHLGRRRRPRVHKHTRDATSIVPTSLHGDWKSRNRFLAQLNFSYKIQGFWTHSLKIFLYDYRCDNHVLRLPKRNLFYYFFQWKINGNENAGSKLFGPFRLGCGVFALKKKLLERF